MSKHLLAVLVLCASVFGQISGGSSSGSSGTGIVKYTVATLPATAALRTIVEITDGLSNQDCTSGGGAATVPCMWNGSAWVAMVVQGAASFSTGTAPTACGSATGCVAGTEASTAGTPAAGQSYFRFDSTSHVLKGSYNNGAEFIMLPVPGTSGNVLKSDGTNWTSAAASAGGITAFYLAGNTSACSGNGTSMFPVSGFSTGCGISTDQGAYQVMAGAGTVSAVYCNVQTAPGGSGVWTFKLSKNVASSLVTACTISASATACNGTPTLSWVAGDLINWQVVGSSAPGASGTVSCSIKVTGS